MTIGMTINDVLTSDGIDKNFMRWLWNKDRQKYALIVLGHIELITNDLIKEFVESEVEEITDNNLCNSCTNIGCEFQSGIVRTKCAFYMPPHIEPDNCGNCVVMQPTVEAIPKADYETRLKADMVAMLTELQLEIEEKFNDRPFSYNHHQRTEFYRDVDEVIQKKINSLKETEDGKDR